MPSLDQETSQTTAQPAHSAVDTVLFDYGMVLSAAPDPAAWAAIRSITGLDEAPLHAAYWEFRHDYDRAALTGRAYWQAVADRTGTTLDDAKFAALAAADVDLWTSLNLPMVEWAARLQQAGIRTGILSNIGDSIAEGIIARFDWLKGFKHCTWSHALFLAKPDPVIYVKTAEALKTTPEHILFIDDKAENLVAAASVGMQTIQYTAHAAFEREMRERGYGDLLDAKPPASVD